MKITTKWAYIKCIRCDKTIYKTLEKLEKMIKEKGSKENIDATFVCKKCSKTEV